MVEQAVEPVEIPENGLGAVAIKYAFGIYYGLSMCCPRDTDLFNNWKKLLIIIGNCLRALTF